ncbi:cyanophycin synthetase [Piscinibacter sakaiensis]|uniref:cyanophycin synthetase n=1 Tax=Piscinibacter sakaiensis TaxID=1547922 RepID=UPI003AAFBC86
MNKKPDIQLLRVTYLRGPNVWTYRPALEVWLDLGELEDFPSNLLPGFNERLLAMLPALGEHHCGVGEPGGFLQRLTEGTWAGHVLEHVVIELLNLAGMPTGFGQTRSTSQRGVYRMVFRARDEKVAREALMHGHRLLMAAINDEPCDVAAMVEQVRERIEECYLGPSTACIVAAATDRKIPHIRLNDGNLVQLGYGGSQRRIWTAETDRTSAIAEGIAHDKDLTKRLLKACGVPVPEGEVVDSADAAWEAAQDIGLPVVVKPSDGNHGRGVTLELSTREDIAAAYDVANAQGSEVIVERYLRGLEHRLLVVGGEVVAAARGDAAWVIGDGKSTVTALVDAQINSDPRRGPTEDFPLGEIKLSGDRPDDVVLLDLQRQGLTPDSVPASGQRVLIQRNGNVAVDCTDEVHPEVARAVTLAARVVGLDIAGVDLVAADIGRPLHEQGGGIVEVNAGPGLLMHLKPAQGSPRPVGRAIVDHLFDEDESGRIPIIGIAGSRDGASIARVVAWLLQLSGRHVGLACRSGLFLDHRRVDAGDCAHFEPAHRLLMNRNVQAVVIENDARAILDDGLAYDRCKVGIVTDCAFDPAAAAALENHDIRSAEQMPRVLRTQVDVVLDDGVAVLNAGDPAVAEMASLCDGEVIFYAADAAAAASETLTAHRAAGGRAVLMRAGRLVLATGNQEVLLADPSMYRRGRRETPGLPASTQAAAAAAAWAVGISPDLIAAGIETFDADPSDLPPVAAPHVAKAAAASRLPPRAS